MDGPSFIARQAAKRLKKEGKPGGVVIHPVAIRYAFQGDLAATLGPDLDELETASVVAAATASVDRRSDRQDRAGAAVAEGNRVSRRSRAAATCTSGPRSWSKKCSASWKPSGRSRIRRAARWRASSGCARAILPDMMAGRVTPEERERRWRDLAAAYYAQQISHYPRDYILREKNLPERVVETVERLRGGFHRPACACTSRFMR